MRFLSFRDGDSCHFGAVVGDGVVNLSARRPDLPDLREAIRQDCLPSLAELARQSPADQALAEVEYLPTLPNPEKIICIGVNYANRNAEYRDDSPQPKYPSVFMRSRESLVGHEQDILDPPESDQLDYEGEIVLVVGRAGRRIDPDDAHRYVAGTTIMNEGTVRDYLRHAKFNVTQGKNFAASGALGPWLVSADELDPFSELQVMTRVNGDERQNDVTGNLVFPFRYLLGYLSTFYHLKPGDLIATGTPNGAGARLDPPRFLRPRDTVEVEVPGIGVLRNAVAAETLA